MCDVWETTVYIKCVAPAHEDNTKISDKLLQKRNNAVHQGVKENKDTCESHFFNILQVVHSLF